LSIQIFKNVLTANLSKLRLSSMQQHASECSTGRMISGSAN
jgi:hypothetical protein